MLAHFDGNQGFDWWKRSQLKGPRSSEFRELCSELQKIAVRRLGSGWRSRQGQGGSTFMSLCFIFMCRCRADSALQNLSHPSISQQYFTIRSCAVLLLPFVATNSPPFSMCSRVSISSIIICCSSLAYSSCRSRRRERSYSLACSPSFIFYGGDRGMKLECERGPKIYPSRG